MSSTIQPQVSLPTKRKKNKQTALAAKGKRIYNLYKTLGFNTIPGSELKKKIDVFIKDLELPVVKIETGQDPEARKLAERFCANDVNTATLWPKDTDNNARRLKWPKDKAKVLNNLTHIFAWKIYNHVRNNHLLGRKEVPTPKDILAAEPNPDSDDELLIPQSHQDLLRITHHLEDDHISSRVGANFRPTAELSAIGDNRRNIDGSNVNQPRDNGHEEYCILHIRHIRPKDDEELMRKFVSLQWLEDTRGTWTSQGSLEPDNYIMRFMHEFMCYDKTQNINLLKFLGLFYEDPSLRVLGGNVNYNILKRRLRDRVKKLAASLVDRKLLVRSRASGKISRTKELDEAWERRNSFWSQPFEDFGVTEQHGSQRRDLYEMSISPERDERATISHGRESSSGACRPQFSGQEQEEQQQKYQQEAPGPSSVIDGREFEDETPTGSRNLPPKRALHLTSTTTSDTGREDRPEKRQRVSTSGQPPISKDKGKWVNRGQNNATGVPQRSNLTPPIIPAARAITIKLEPTPVRARANISDPKPSPFLTPSPQPEVQTSDDEPSSDDDLPLATFSNDINFVLLAKQKFDFEHPLNFNIAELEDISFSSFISLFAVRTGFKVQRIDGLKFTICLGDNRLEKVMKGDERRWEQVIEIIGDLWKYSQVKWANDPRLKSKVCKILTERVVEA